MHVDPPESKKMLCPQEQLAVALLLKTPNNKSKAAREAGYASAHVFDKPHVRAAVAEAMQERAQRLMLGADFVLLELKKCYDTSVSLVDMKAALRALDLMGRHTDIQAWQPETESASDQEKVAVLMRARQRAREAHRSEMAGKVVPAALEQDDAEQPPVSFLEPESPPAEASPNFMEPIPYTTSEDAESEQSIPEQLSPRANQLIEKLRSAPDDDEMEFEPVTESLAMRDRGDIDGREPLTIEGECQRSFERCYSGG